MKATKFYNLASNPTLYQLRLYRGTLGSKNRAKETVWSVEQLLGQLGRFYQTEGHMIILSDIDHDASENPIL